MKVEEQSFKKAAERDTLVQRTTTTTGIEAFRLKMVTRGYIELPVLTYRCRKAADALSPVFRPFPSNKCPPKDGRDGRSDS